MSQTVVQSVVTIPIILIVTTKGFYCNNEGILLFVKTEAIIEGILVKYNVEGNSKL